MPDSPHTFLNGRCTRCGSLNESATCSFIVEEAEIVRQRALVDRYQKCSQQIWGLFASDPLPSGDPAQSWLAGLESLVANGLLHGDGESALVAELRQRILALESDAEKASAHLYKTGATRGDVVARAERAADTYHSLIMEISDAEATVDHLIASAARALIAGSFDECRDILRAALHAPSREPAEWTPKEGDVIEWHLLDNGGNLLRRRGALQLRYREVVGPQDNCWIVSLGEPDERTITSMSEPHMIERYKNLRLRVLSRGGT